MSFISSFVACFSFSFYFFLSLFVVAILATITYSLLSEYPSHINVLSFMHLPRLPSKQYRYIIPL